MASQPLHLAWSNPVQIHWGAGCFQSIALDGPVVVLADRAALTPDAEAALALRLGGNSRHWSWFRGGLASVELAQTLCAELWPVLAACPDATLLAIGGGSTLDLAKVLRYRLEQGEPAAHWRANSVPAEHVRHPLWLVPTTAGTGSEVTRWATLWDTGRAEPVKLSWAPALGHAERAWIDPELSLSCPLRQSRDCALDTLAHALESLWNRNANPVTEALALEAARIVIANLPELMPGAEGLHVRCQLSRASLLAGLAMSHTQTALAHALSYGLTLRESLPHGEACAVWLPMVWELAVGASDACDAVLGRVFGVPAAAGTRCLRQWLLAQGIAARDMRDTPDGRETLEREMRSVRGRNFIGAA